MRDGLSSSDIEAAIVAAVLEWSVIDAKLMYRRDLAMNVGVVKAQKIVRLSEPMVDQERKMRHRISKMGRALAMMRLAETM